MTTSENTPNTPRRLPTWVVMLSFAVLIGFLALVGTGMRRSQEGPITIGSQVPAIKLHTFDGQVIDTADLQGKVLVINFWASWCIPCEEEAEALELAWQHYQPGGQVVFLGFNWSDTEPEAREYLERFNVTYPNGPDLRTAAAQIFRIIGVPETYIVGPDGTLAYVKKGPFTLQSDIHAVIDPLLQ